VTPLITSIFTYFGQKLRSGLDKIIAIFGIGVSFILSAYLFTKAQFEDFEISKFNFIKLNIVSDNSINFVLQMDGLTVLMLFVASFLGFLIAVFSFEYMASDKHITRYWFYMQLFIFGMLLLVAAGDLITLYIGWEIVGLCSYGLISHWHDRGTKDDEKCSQAGLKAFILTRIGDLGLLISIIILWSYYGTVEFEALKTKGFSDEVITFIGMMLLLAAFSKSAQFPFIPWLSSAEEVDIDAMQGPTTVSALIHAATMVKAGIYLIARMYLILPLYRSELFVATLIIIPGITMVITALSALVSDDLKRILAYSTVSQLSYMFLSLGIAYSALYSDFTQQEISQNAYQATLFHLWSHAMFKGLLFLTAGYIIHSFHERNIKQISGRVTFQDHKIAATSILFGGFALIGLFPFTGFWSKDLILHNILLSYEEGIEWSLFALIVAYSTAFLTAGYVMRMIYYLMLVPSESIADTETHSQYPLMKLVMVILSVATLFGGIGFYFISHMFENQFNHEFHPVGKDLGIVILLQILVIGVFLMTYYLFKSERNKTVVGLPGISILARVAKKGFFLDNFWTGLKNISISSSYKFRRLHTGKLNSMVFGSSMVATVFIILIVVM
jgi:NADH-quinone oxidoreductase subunit L